MEQIKNYKLLDEIVPEILAKNAQRIKLSAGEGFMPLNVEWLSGNRIAIAHNFEQNGDLMCDPDMEVILDETRCKAIARTYQNDGLGIFQSLEISQSNALQRELDVFLNQWLCNIRAQGYRREQMTVDYKGERVTFHFDTSSGALQRADGSTPAVNGYIQDNNIVALLRPPAPLAP